VREALAATPLTAVVAQLGVRWVAAGSGIESQQVIFFSILHSFLVFCNQICLSFRNIFTYSEKHQGDVAL